MRSPFIMIVQDGKKGRLKADSGVIEGPFHPARLQSCSKTDE